MVLISLRDPVARAFSQYRYAFNNHTEALRDAVEQSTGIMRRCFDRHLAGTDLSGILCVCICGLCACACACVHVRVRV